MGPLRISGTTSRLDCSRQLRRYVAQHGHTIGIVKPGGGTNSWKRPLLPSRQLSRPGRLVKALGDHTMQPNEMPDMQCTMLVKKPTRRSTRILTPSLQKSTALLTSLKERTLMLLVTNLWRMMQDGLAKIKGTLDIARKSFFELHANIMPYLKFCCTNPTRGSPKIFPICIE